VKLCHYIIKPVYYWTITYHQWEHWSQENHHKLRIRYDEAELASLIAELHPDLIKTISHLRNVPSRSSQNLHEAPIIFIKSLEFSYSLTRDSLEPYYSSLFLTIPHYIRLSRSSLIRYGYIKLINKEAIYTKGKLFHHGKDNF